MRLPSQSFVSQFDMAAKLALETIDEIAERENDENNQDINENKDYECEENKKNNDENKQNVNEQKETQTRKHYNRNDAEDEHQTANQHNLMEDILYL
eukprot:1510415-Amphidinium_carterae.2